MVDVGGGRAPVVGGSVVVGGASVVDVVVVGSVVGVVVVGGASVVDVGELRGAPWLGVVVVTLHVECADGQHHAPWLADPLPF